jgi:Fic family protein
VLLDATRGYAEPLTWDRLRGWHAALFPSPFSGLQKIRVGELRGEAPMQVVSGYLERRKVHFQAPPRTGLELGMDAFFAAFEQRPPSLDGLLHAGLMHLHFVTLHPFEDGNGRLARALTDLAMARDEGQPWRFLSLSSQLLRVREDYYLALETSQRGGLEVTPWLEFFLHQVRAAAGAAQDKIAATLAKARFWIRHQGQDLNERQRKVLNRLLDAGPGGFEGGRNTRKYQGLTHASRATSYRELADLVEKGCLLPLDKGGRSTAYEVAWLPSAVGPGLPR